MIKLKAVKFTAHCMAMFALAMPAAAVAGGVPLKEGVARWIQGQEVKCVQVGKHGFYLRQIGTFPKGRGQGIVRTETGLTVSGRIKHIRSSYDDVIDYIITIEKGKAPTYSISIRYGGF
jgi:hypothetical protein